MWIGKHHESVEPKFGWHFIKILPIFVLFLFLGSSCVSHQPRTKSAQEIINEKFLIIAHRGARHFAPENTMAAFRYAAEHGWGFELDTMFCKSGELVVIHDTTVDRTTNGKGFVKDFTLTELQQLDAGSSFAKNFVGEKIPTLKQVLDEFGGRIVIDIEIKAGKGTTTEEAKKIAEQVAKLLEERNLEKKVFISSFNPFVLERLAEVSPQVLRAQLYSNFADVDMAYYKKVILRNLLLNGRAMPDLLAPDYKMVDKDYIEKYHELGYRIFPYTVNEGQDIIKLIQNGIDGLITDRPDLVEKELSKK